MAVIHQAWTFDPGSFHRWLEERTVRDGALRLDLLRGLAMSVFEGASRGTKRALEWMRLDDEEWLEEPGPDESHADEWYMVTLAGRLDPAPSLSSNRNPASFRVLERVLPLAGWSEEEIKLLIFGRPLGSLARSFGNGPLADEFGGSLDGHRDRGWLDPSTAEGLLSRLWTAEGYFFSPPPEVVGALEEAGAAPGQKPEVLEIAHGDAEEMLQTALERKQPLFLVLD